MRGKDLEQRGRRAPPPRRRGRGARRDALGMHLPGGWRGDKVKRKSTARAEVNGGETRSRESQQPAQKSRPLAAERSVACAPRAALPLGRAHAALDFPKLSIGRAALDFPKLSIGDGYRAPAASTRSHRPGARPARDRARERDGRAGRTRRRGALGKVARSTKTFGCRTPAPKPSGAASGTQSDRRDQ